MILHLEIRGERVYRRLDGGEGASASGSAGELETWAERYDRATVSGAEGVLSTIGGEIFAWLDEDGFAAEWAVSPYPELEIRVDPATEDARLTGALLGVPWELVAPDGIFLAADPDRLFTVARRIGRPGTPVESRHSDLALMFMAAAPVGMRELDFEAEEAAILEATRGRTGTGDPLAHVVVEESGCIDFLKERLSRDGPFEVLHLSCHGTIDAERGPVLALETDVGEHDPVDPGAIVSALGADKAPLVFVSACRTAEALRTSGALDGSAGRKQGLEEPRVPFAGADAETLRDAAEGTEASGADKAYEMVNSFVRRLAQAGVANVLGWEGSVYDVDATLFAETFYGELANMRPVPEAAAEARRALFRKHAEDPRRGTHWHLARVYLGPAGWLPSGPR